MNSATVILLASGIVCLLISGFMMYKLMPRPDRPVTNSDTRETAMALGQFILMVAGLALVAKGLL